MKLILNAQYRQLVENAKASTRAIMRDGNTPDHMPVVKLFHPLTDATWLLTELHEDGRMFGLCHVHEPEIGYVSLDEIQSSHAHGIKVERDRHWESVAPLSVYARRARVLGRVPDNNELDDDSWKDWLDLQQRTVEYLRSQENN